MTDSSSSATELNPSTPTGLPSLDDAIRGGFKPEQLALLAGPTGAGKSALASQIALFASEWAAANNQGDVLYFSYEMSVSDLTTRLLIQATRGLRDGYHMPAGWSGRDRPLIEAAREKINALPLRITEAGAHDYLSLEVEISNNMQARGRRPALVVVDHLGLVGSANPGSDEEIRERVVRGLKEMARELKVPILALGQFTRRADLKNPDNRPNLSYLRGSSAIESAAHLVLLLHAPYIYLHDAEERKRLVASGARVNLIVAKNRSGTTTEIELEWIGPQLIFRELPR